VRELDAERAAALDARLATLAERFDAVVHTAARGNGPAAAEAPPTAPPERSERDNAIADYLLRTVGTSLAIVARVLETPPDAAPPSAAAPA
jgi:hypothetical protein